ncbi:MAG: molybdopterin-dependent oxidoreductase [Candidatus Limnocylindrales bacterium]
MTAQPGRRSLIAGFIAAGPALLILVLGRLAFDRPGLIEVVSDGFSRFLPVEVFEVLISTLGSVAKGLLTLGIAAGIVIAGALLGRLALDLTRRRGPFLATVLVAVSALLVVELLVLPIFGAGFVGSEVVSEGVALQGPIVAAAIVFATLLIGLRETGLQQADAPGAVAVGDAAAFATVAGSDPTPEVPLSDERPVIRQAPSSGDLTRRGFIGRALLAIGGVAFAGSFLTLISQVLASPRNSRDTTAGADDPGGFGPTPAQTPVEDFYTVNKNLGPTLVEAATWALVIDGLVDRPTRIDLAELQTLPYQEAYRTLECISTDIVRGDHLIGNQKWRGVRVADLLDRVGAQAAATWVLWEADDGFTESLPIEVARHPDTWIAYLMGDAALTPEHGFPARVLIPGRFGMKPPKWLRRMQLADHEEAGYWVQRGWDEEAVVRTMSRIDWPANLAVVEVAKPLTAYGIAFAGDRGIARVEVSPDGGSSWVEAELEDAVTPPLGELTWVRWRADLIAPAEPGGMEIVVRATDGDGETQSGEVTPALPSGSTGWHGIVVSAA